MVNTDEKPEIFCCRHHCFPNSTYAEQHMATVKEWKLQGWGYVMVIAMNIATRHWTLLVCLVHWLFLVWQVVYFIHRQLMWNVRRKRRNSLNDISIFQINCPACNHYIVSVIFYITLFQYLLQLFFLSIVVVIQSNENEVQSGFKNSVSVLRI